MLDISGGTRPLLKNKKSNMVYEKDLTPFIGEDEIEEEEEEEKTEETKEVTDDEKGDDEE